MTTVLIAGIFPVDVLGVPETAFGFIHIITNLCSLLILTIAAILLSWRFKYDERWLPYHRPALILALVMLVASIWISLMVFFFIGTGFLKQIMGILVVTSLIWIFLTTARLWFVSSHLQVSSD
jgi:hypothetical protein